SRATRSGFCSITSTSCPASLRSAAMNVPTFPAPAIATLTVSLPSSVVALGAGESFTGLVHRVGAHREIEDVALLTDERRCRQSGLATPPHRHQPEAVALVELGQLAAGPGVGHSPLDQAHLAARVGPLAHHPVGQ